MGLSHMMSEAFDLARDQLAKDTKLIERKSSRGAIFAAIGLFIGGVLCLVLALCLDDILRDFFVNISAGLITTSVLSILLDRLFFRQQSNLEKMKEANLHLMRLFDRSDDYYRQLDKFLHERSKAERLLQRAVNKNPLERLELNKGARDIYIDALENYQNATIHLEQGLQPLYSVQNYATEQNKSDYAKTIKFIIDSTLDIIQGAKTGQEFTISKLGKIQAVIKTLSDELGDETPEPTDNSDKD